MKNKLWFKAKTYGWGWTPCSIEGWICLLVFILFTIWNFNRIDAASHSVSDTVINFIPETFISILVLVSVCYIQGEKPGWRWGNKR